jgi:diguanylate cyclase (GGDEF)-like protein
MVPARSCNTLQCSNERAAKRPMPFAQCVAMLHTTETLGLAAAALVVAATALTALGQRQRRYEGWKAWTAALWLSALGCAIGSWWPAAPGQALAHLLLLQWPLWAVAGLRSFHPRQALPGRPWQDWAALALASLLVAGGYLAGRAGEPLVLAGTAAVHLYAATLLVLGPAGREFAPAQFLAAALALVGLAPTASALPLARGPSALAALGAAAALGGLVLAFVAITMVCERTERQLRDSRRRLRVLANLDTLTQVPNRRHFHELAEHTLRQDEPGTAALLSFDVDHFKQINDLFGHAACDRALCLVSGAMLEHLRAQDVPGRQGGDEFVLLLRRTSARDAMGVAARIVHEVQRRAPLHQLPTLSLSFGVVQIAFGEGIQAAMRRADQALYEAKRQGRSRAVAAEGNESQPVFAESQRLGLMPA